MRFGVALVAFLEFSAYLKRLLQGHSRRERYHLSDLIALRDRHIKDSGNVFYRLPGRKRTERDNMRHPVFAVFLGNIIDSDLSSLIFMQNNGNGLVFNEKARILELFKIKLAKEFSPFKGNLK